jgi:hypothetical protein
MSRRDRRDAPAEIDWSTEGEPVHTNGVRTVCSSRGVAIVFTDYQPFPGRAAAAGSYEPRERVVASLRTSPETFFELVASFASAWNQFVLEQGKPDLLPRFRLFGRQGLQLEGTEDPDED